MRPIRQCARYSITTCFHVDTVLIIKENYSKRPAELRTFLSSLLGFRGLRIYYLTLLDQILAIRYMERFGLEFDDALAYCIVRKFNLRVMISYDKHFDSSGGIVRLEPAQL